MICNTNSIEFSNGLMHGNFPSHFQSAQYSTSATAILSINIVSWMKQLAVRMWSGTLELLSVQIWSSLITFVALSLEPIYALHKLFDVFFSRNLPLMSRAFTTYVRPTLEYASVTWSPSQITQIILLEGVQRTFSKRLPGLANLSYAERISILKLQSLEHRRLISDLIEVYKIIHNLSSLQFEDFFSYPTCNSTRGHPFRLSVPVAKIDERKFFFACRVVPIWNFLPIKQCSNGPYSSKF